MEVNNYRNFVLRSPLYVKVLWLCFTLSSLVYLEPAPYDLLIILLMLMALGLTHLTISTEILITFILINIYINANLISLLFVTKDVMEAGRFLLITLYLTGSWMLFITLLQRFKQFLLPVIFSGYFVAAIASTLVGILAFWGVIPHSEGFLLYGEIAGLFKDPNVYGPFLIPMVLYALAKFEEELGGKKYLWIIGAIFLSLGVLLSFSRAAWGNYFLSLLIYFLLNPWRNLKGRLLTLIVIFLGASTFIIMVLNYSNEVHQLFFQKLGYQSYDNDRFGTQLASLIIALDNPLGIGPYQTEEILDYSTHSLYIRVLTESGIFGFAAFILILALTIFRALQHNIYSKKNLLYRSYLSIVTASLMGILFNSFFIDTLHWRHFWVLLAIPWLPIEKGDEEISNRSDCD